MADQLERLARLLRPLRDVIEGRVTSPVVPVWAQVRGWDVWLASLDDDALEHGERVGLPSIPLNDAPPTLVALCQTANALIGPYVGRRPALAPFETDSVPLRKRSQVAAMIEQCRRWSKVERIVDVGAGHGHLARALVGTLGVPVVAIDHDADRVERARALSNGGPLFAVGDGRDVAVGAGDLLVGLHACGDLGDAIVQRAVARRSHLLLVSCCMQKIAGTEREPVSALGRKLGLTMQRNTLGLSNLAWGKDVGRALHGRQVRHALRLLLAERGVQERPGKEAHGIQRKRFRRGLRAVADMALARRGLAAASNEEIRDSEERAASQYALMRRYSLPRGMLGRLLELMVVLDRATYLEEEGYRASVSAVFDVDTSPRNLGLAATL